MQNQIPETERPRFGNAKEVAKLLGLPKSTIYTRAAKGAIPGVVRVGHRMLFDLQKLTAWLDAGGDLVK